MKIELPAEATITVIGRRWFEKVNGNTYHSCEVYVNGDLIGKEKFTYGYDRAYMQTAAELMSKKYVLPIGINDFYPLWKFKELGFHIIDSVTDVQRKKDL